MKKTIKKIWFGIKYTSVMIFCVVLFPVAIPVGLWYYLKTIHKKLIK